MTISDVFQHDCEPRTPIARELARIVKLRGPSKDVWNFVHMSALPGIGVAIRFCPFCGVDLEGVGRRCVGAAAMSPVSFARHALMGWLVGATMFLTNALEHALDAMGKATLWHCSMAVMNAAGLVAAVLNARIAYRAWRGA